VSFWGDFNVILHHFDDFHQKYVFSPLKHRVKKMVLQNWPL